MIAPVRHLRALTRSWPGRLILAVVAIQLALPLHYYLSPRRDPHDERFAWRMFSPIRMARCEPRFYRDDAPIDLASQFHEAWLGLASRGRFDVIEAMAASLCERHRGAAIRVTLDCTYLDRSTDRYGGYDLCDIPQLSPH